MEVEEIAQLDAADREYGAAMKKRGRRLLWASVAARRIPGPLPSVSPGRRTQVVLSTTSGRRKQ